MRTQLLLCLTLSFFPIAVSFCQDTPTPDPTKETQAGIPVTDKLTVAKCGTCHQQDKQGNLTRISWIRTTPEGWQEATKRMIELNGVKLAPEEARQIVRYLANDHGLAPEEAQPVRWYLEMTQPQTEPIPTPGIRRACATCHAFARPQTWRRSAAEWHLLKNMHIGYYPLSQFVSFSDHSPHSPADSTEPKPKKPVDEALAYLSKNYDLYSASWSNWRAQMTDPDLSGRWALTATAPGKGKYFGEMVINKAGAGEFTTQTTLTSARDGSKLTLPGRSFIYTGYEWRGSAKSPEFGMLRQVMTLSADASQLQGRWFWGAYQEFGFTVAGQRESADPTVLGTDVASVRFGKKDVPMKIYGQHFPSDLKSSDIKFGAGLSVSKIVAITPTLISLTVNTNDTGMPGKRPVSVRGHLAPDAFSIYDKVEYIKVTAETALAHTGGAVGKKGFVQFEAHAFSNGLDGLPNTADDVDLGPIQAKWSIEEFIAHNSDNDKEFVGYIDSDGLFTPSLDGPNPQRRFSADNIGDVWAVARYAGNGPNTPPLEAKSYLVITVPTFLHFDAPEISTK